MISASYGEQETETHARFKHDINSVRISDFIHLFTYTYRKPVVSIFSAPNYHQRVLSLLCRFPPSDRVSTYNSNLCAQPTLKIEISFCNTFLM